MKREHLAFLFGGFAFGTLFGFALFYAVANPPELADAAATAGMPTAPRGSMAPAQVGDAADGGAPMMARINQLRRVVQDDPRDVGALVELADIYQRGGMWEQAADYYEQAIAVEEGHPELLVNLGLCYRGMGEFDRALETFAHARRHDPAHWQALFNTVVVAAVDLGRFETAFEALEALESLQPRPEGLDPENLTRLREWLVESRTASESQDQG